MATVLHAQAQQPITWDPVVALSQRVADSSVYVTKVVPDGQGNLYVAGSIAGRVHLGSTTLESTRNYYGSYTGDIFVGKYSLSTGRYLWATSTGGNGGESARELVVVGNSIYLAGTTRAPAATTARLTFGATTYTTTAGFCLFVAKLTDQGSRAAWQWGKVGVNDYLSDLVGLGVNGTSVYLAGDLSGTMKWDTKTAKSNQALAYNADDLLVVKITDAGSTATVAWAQCIGSATYENADAFAMSGNNLYFAGDYFNTSTIGGTPLPNTGTGTSTDAFVIKLTDTGPAVAPVWVQHLGGTGTDVVRALALNGSTLYLGGNTGSRRLALGPGLALAARDTARGANTPFLARLTDAGPSSSFQWAAAVPGAGDTAVEQLLRAGGQLYVGGSFSGDSVTLGRTVLRNRNPLNTDLYALRLEETPTGATPVWAGRLGSTSYDFLYSLLLLNDRLYVQAYNTAATTIGATAVPAGTSYLAAAVPQTPLATTGATTLPGTRVHLYPNPAHAAATLALAGLPARATHVQLTLLDATGRTVGRHRLGTAGGPLPLAGLAPGLYGVRLTAQDAQGRTLGELPAQRVSVW
ncbi:hypothetical protein [Hymenobacter nivis]|uniref:T9SS C-terminal target domain-containing protein n=1 Tax=Hymenobacter nivis TaxID=1850093 RepID=A0A502GCB6_9BACT|nr:hypothetical protein [Hymenobacter nivis]TPG59494.1 hypothetical protein EAH73_21520 [Hymenobacter nivis]